MNCCSEFLSLGHACLDYHLSYCSGRDARPMPVSFQFLLLVLPHARWPLVGQTRVDLLESCRGTRGRGLSQLAWLGLETHPRLRSTCLLD